MPTTISPRGELSRHGNAIVITSSRVVLDDNRDAVPATIEISPLSGKFVAIHPRKATANEYPSTVQFIDYGELVIMPGLVDSHVHIDEP
jgi:allantoinase